MCGRQNVAVTPGPGDGSAAVDPRRPYPYITPTFYDKSIGKASYNGFQFKLRRNTTKGLSYIVSYTWSKVINLGCDGSFGAEGCYVQQVYDFKANRSVAGFDIPHLLNANATYDLPFGAGKQFSSDNKALNAIIGHWALNGIFTIRSGEPFSVGVNGDIPNVGGSNNVRREHHWLGHSRNPNARSLSEYRRVCRPRRVHLWRCGPKCLPVGQIVEHRPIPDAGFPHSSGRGDPAAIPHGVL